MSNLLAATLLGLCLLADGTHDWLFDRVDDPDVVSYRVDVAVRTPTFYACLDDDGLPTTCVTYPAPEELTWESVDTVLQSVPPAGYSLCTTWDEGTMDGTELPVLNSVIYVNVRAVDSSGNVGS